MFGGLSTSWPMTFVFLTLMVRSKSLHTLEKQSISCRRLHSSCVATAASSAKENSLRVTARTLVFALSLEKLNNFPSDLVWRKVPSVGWPNACLRSTTKKIPNRVGQVHNLVLLHCRYQMPQR